MHVVSIKKFETDHKLNPVRWYKTPLANGVNKTRRTKYKLELINLNEIGVLDMSEYRAKDWNKFRTLVYASGRHQGKVYGRQFRYAIEPEKHKVYVKRVA